MIEFLRKGLFAKGKEFVKNTSSNSPTDKRNFVSRDFLNRCFKPANRKERKERGLCDS